jgi:hypothetical protein
MNKSKMTYPVPHYIHCKCGKYISEYIFDRHLYSSYHERRMGHIRMLEKKPYIERRKIYFKQIQAMDRKIKNNSLCKVNISNEEKWLSFD